ncbi:MAG TPA: 50S ribosomal protein L6 [Nitrospiria bacterium]|jgi:large subunit ribosomal protein L6|nr:50S ribosomal protein L6 [Nitrospiria bacterium]
MSRVGKKAIAIPGNVKVKIEDREILVHGPKGELKRQIPPSIQATITEGQLVFSRISEERHVRSLHGLTRSEVANMITGVTLGYSKVLEINGVGYRAQMKGRTIMLSIGFSHPVNFELPNGIEASVEKQTILTIQGIDKYLVGQVSARLRSLRPPEPYKGKGIKYQAEKIIRKEGKTGK